MPSASSGKPSASPSRRQPLLFLKTAILFLVLLLPLSAAAQPAQDSLGEVVVAATQKEAYLKEGTIPIEVYAASLFRKNPSPTLFESLNMVNGLQPQLNCNVCNTGDIHINGLEGPYTMILIDGMPIVSSLSTVYGLHGIPQSLVRRIEVVKGPASTLYGSEAVAGVINIITQDPGSAPRLQVDASATSIGELNLDASAGLSAGKRLRLLTGVNLFGYSLPKDINGDNFTDVTLQQRASFFTKISLARKSGLPASLALRYVHENRWGGEMQWSRRWEGTDSVYGESIRTRRAEAFGTWGLGGGLRLDYSYNLHDQDSYYGTTAFRARQHTAFAQLVEERRIGKTDLIAGLPVRFIHYDDNTPGTGKAAETFLPGLFLQTETQHSARITTLTGLRLDYHREHGGILTPRIGLRYKARKDHTLRISAGSGFRTVNLFTEDHAALTGAREVIIRNDLKPERSWNASLSYSTTAVLDRGFINTDASLFYTYFSNQIVGDFLSHPNQIIYDNLSGYAISRGLSVNIDAGFANSFKILLGATYMNVFRKVEGADGRLAKVPQLHAPAFSGTFAVSYTIPGTGVSADLTGRVNGPMHLPVVPNDYRPEMSPLHCLLNLQLSRRLGKQLEIYGGAKNLLNFIPKDPILRPFDPFDKEAGNPQLNPAGYTFDPSYNYAPIQGTKAYLGLRWTVPAAKGKSS